MIRELAAAIESGESLVLATVVRTEQSVPRRPGSKMLVYADGRISGTIGGGEMEHRVREAAAEVLAERRPRVISYSLLDPADGDAGVCGGVVEIYLEPHMPGPAVFIIGAGHVGKAVNDLATWLGLRTVVWDDREGLAADTKGADVVASGEITDLLGDNPVQPGDAVVMVTRNVALDVGILPVLLETPAEYLGLMGSERRWSTTREKLEDAGVSAESLDRVHAPIGVEISAETPEEIAVSILAEVIGDLRGS